MALVWFSVIVLLYAQNVFANVCESQIQSCDQCIRCGATWCSEITDEHCSFSTTDVFCGGKPEQLTKIDVYSKKGVAFDPIYMERTLLIGNRDRFPFVYWSPEKRKVSAYMHNSTQNFGSIEVKPDEASCTKSQCTVNIDATVDPEFCISRGTTHEYIYVQIKVENMTEEALVKYHVPCACECSKIVEKKSPKCSGHGDLSCGVCKCYRDWYGEKCDELKCGSKRGDVQCNNPLKNDEECSGNGYCGPCETCICYDDRVGSQYFDADNYCSDICMDSSAFGHCLTNGTLGVCTDSQSETLRFDSVHQMTIKAYNETTVIETDYEGKKIWVRCNDTFPLSTEEDKCQVQYYAMRSEDGRIYAMVFESCTNVNPGGRVAEAGSAKVPIILGVLGIIAAVAAVGGIMLWKHLNAVPPMPFSSPDYQNIDAEDCVGENPLYKSPTSTFTNPQFGKC